MIDFGTELKNWTFNQVPSLEHFALHCDNKIEEHEGELI